MEEDQEDFEIEEDQEDEEEGEEEEEEEGEEEEGEDVDIVNEEENYEGHEDEDREDVDIVEEEEQEDFEEDEHEEEYEEGEDVDILDEEEQEDFEEDEQEEEHEDGEDLDIVEEEEQEDFEEDEQEEDVDTVDGDEENYEDEETMDLIPAQMTSPILSSSTAQGTTLQASVMINGGPEKSNLCEGNQRKHDNGDGDVVKESLNRGEIDDLLCPICFQAWTSNGEHQICCLPCGHIYGLSCINKWLQQTPNSSKCPQCNGLCTLKDVRVLYATNLRVVDEELQKYKEHLELTQRLVKEMSRVLRLLADQAAIPIPTWLSESVPTDHDPVDDTPPSTAM